MSFIPYAVLWVGLIVAAAVCLTTERRPRLRIVVILTTLLPSIALWLLIRPDTVTPALNIAGRQWIIDDVAWTLTGITFLLLATAVIQLFTDRTLRNPARHSAIALALVAAALPSLWAGDARTRILGATLFALTWGLSAWITGPRSDSDASRGKYYWAHVLFAVFPLWVGFAVPDWEFIGAVVAAIILMSAWPLDSRGVEMGGRPADGLVRGLPILIGAAVLAKPIASGALRPAEIAVGTAIGLLGFAIGLARAWGRPSERALALGLALVGLVFVASIWAGTEALLASARLAVFAPFLLGLIAGAPGQAEGVVDREPEAIGKSAGLPLTPQSLGRAVVYVALAGLPLTVGFTVLSLLYETWRLAGGWVLLLVVVLILTLWLAVITVAGRSAARAATSPGRDEWLRATAFLPAIIGLISLDLSGAASGWITWVAILIPPMAGWLIGRFLPVPDAFGELWREAVAMPVAAAGLTRRLREAGSIIADAVSDALAILSGEFGLLWLLGLLLLLIVMT